MRFGDFKNVKEKINTKLKYSPGGWKNVHNFEVIEGF